MSLAKRIPIVPTVLVLLAVAVMVRLGFWQLDRMGQKEALIAQYSAAARLPAIKHDGPINDPALLFRRIETTCLRIDGGGGLVAGRNARGETGWAQEVNCSAMERAGPHEENVEGWKSSEMLVVIGWTRAPREAEWPGGPITGILAPGAGNTIRIIANPPQAGLEANATPDPRDVPNNHWSYAIQWFLFAATALVIYGLALRKRLKAA